MLYTRTGDAGESGLFGTKERFPKDSPIYEALGTLDELNSHCGLARAKAARAGGSVDIADLLHTVQEHLFILQAQYAGSDKAITQMHVDWLEEGTDALERAVGNPQSFVVPGANELSAELDVARSVARRAERALIRTKGVREIAPQAYAYLNRLSSLLYALARAAAHTENGEAEEHPTYE